MQYHLLQWEVAKVKPLMNSNTTLAVLNLHQKTHKGATTKIQVKRYERYKRNKIVSHIPVERQNSIRYARSKVKSRSHHDVRCIPITPDQCPYQRSYGFRNIAQTRHYRSRSLQQGQRSNQGHTMMFYIYTP